MTVNRGRGIIDTPSNHSVDETVERLKGILQAKGVTLFALVDQRRSGKSWNENVFHQAADFRESEGRHSRDAGGAQ
jgi:hypothetical protein